MIVETWKRHGDRILPAWCDWSDEDERKVKPSQKRFSCLRKPDAVAKSTGDEWRSLAWEEYCTERQKDGNFSKMEKPYFDRVISYCKSAEDADRFCSSWRK